jgi:PAS domain S-box-containing protein
MSGSEPDRVLYVDDDPRIPDVEAALAGADDRLSVEVATDADDGLAGLRDGDVDCVVCGYRLPDRDGIAFLEAVRDAYPDLPFVLFTDEGDETVASEAIAAGVTDYVPTSGPDYAALADRVAAAAAASRPPDDAERYRRRFEQVLKTVPSCVVQLDPAGEFTFANERARDVLGLERDAVTDRTYDDPAWEIRDLDGEPIPDDDLPFSEVMATGEPVYGRRHTIRWPDGTRRTLLVNGAPLFDCQGAVDGAVFALSDITDRMDRERALERLHAATRELIEATSIDAVARVGSETATDVLDLPMNGVHLAGPDDEWLEPAAWTEASETLLDGEPPALPVADSLAGRVYRTGEPAVYSDVREATGVLDPDTPFRSELHVPLGDHGVLIASSPEPEDFDAADEALARVLAANVESALDRVERERELERRNERLDAFASVVSHDLRNPLQVASGRLELARADCDSDHLDHVAAAHDRMRTLVDDLLRLARDGDRVDDPTPVDLAETVDACWESVATADATLAVDTERTVRADPGQLRRLLENLLGNAVDHGGDGVDVTVGDLDRGFYVVDDGPGISPDERERVFEAGRSTDDAGVGLGLSIVRQIADAHGWDVRVTDGDPDGDPDGDATGARFEIRDVDPVED